MDMNNMTREDIICMMDAEIDFAIGDYGWCCADGHWLTYEELSQWTDEDYLKEYERVYLNREVHSKREALDFDDE
ncbi:hypothetical protein [Pseudoflavonifractor phocaeensis]|uniref:hypothetical protein n=1 Tax=Oscillospiraceae TaxID=216572 RepID=UPI00174D67B4|nr:MULTISPECIES: hypothetical protein [Oscillospiraceae]MDM8239208.1 hypothetical protein [Pseudoflavonifractor phocaeensis]